MLFRQNRDAGTPAPPHQGDPLTRAAMREYDIGTPALEGISPAIPKEPVVDKKLGEMLVDDGIVTAAQLAEALRVQKEQGGFLGKILVGLNYLSQDQLINHLVKQCRIPHLNLLDYQIEKDTLAYLPQDLCLKYMVLPIDRLGRILTVAMVDPFDNEALAAIRTECPELKIKTILCDWRHFDEISAKVFGQQKSEESDDWSGMGLLGSLSQTIKEGSPEDTPEVSNIVDSLIKEAGDADGPDIPVIRETPLPRREPIASEPEPVQPRQPGKPAQVAAPTPAPTPAPVAQTPPPASAPTGLSATQLASVLRETVQQTMNSMAERMAPPPQPPVQQGPLMSPEDLASVLKTTVYEAVTAAAQHAPAPPPPPQPAPGIPVEDLGALLRQTVQEAVAAVVQTMPSQAPPPPPPPQPAGITSEDLAMAMKTAMQEVASVMAQTMRPPEPPPVAPPPAPTLSPEDLTVSLKAAMQEVASVMAQNQQHQSDDHAGGLTPEQFTTALRTAMEEVSSTFAKQVNTVVQRVETNTLAEMNRIELLSNEKDKARKRKYIAQGSAPEEAEWRETPVVEQDERILTDMEYESLVPEYTFGGFIVGENNRFTVTLAKAVAGNPGGEYNPFFVYGSVGLGKTHLINAIGNEIREKFPNQRVGYVSASHFARKLAEASEDQALETFRENYARRDVLILDDIQFLGGRIEAQEEFFHLFNAMHHNGRQIVIAADKAPDKLGLLEQRLVSRFSGGIVAGLTPPDMETRMAILRHYAAQSEIQASPEILSFIAVRVPNDVRKMTGALSKVLAFARLTGQPLTYEMAVQGLKHLNAQEQE